MLAAIFATSVAEWLVAAGTLSLAGATVGLALITRSEIEASWQPLVVPLVAPEHVQIIDDEVGPGATFAFDVKNEGRGPAVDLTFSLITTAEATALPARHVLPIISPNAVEKLRFHLSDRPLTESGTAWLLEIKYQDVARNDLKTGVLYSADLRVLRVTLPTIQTTYRARNLMRRRVRRA